MSTISLVLFLWSCELHLTRLPVQNRDILRTVGKPPLEVRMVFFYFTQKAIVNGCEKKNYSGWSLVNFWGFRISKTEESIKIKPAYRHLWSEFLIFTKNRREFRQIVRLIHKNALFFFYFFNGILSERSRAFFTKRKRFSNKKKHIIVKL